MNWRLLYGTVARAALCSLLLACAANAADTPPANAADKPPANATVAPPVKAGATPDPKDVIIVNGTRDPVNKSYRKMLRGMDLFEKMHAMAPAATLRFKLLPRQRDTKMDGIVVEIIGDTVTVPVQMAADRTFVLERDQQAMEENAAVMPNRKSSTMTWRAEVRTPGLPANTRRLGDLRLECHVGMEAGLISNTLPGLGLIANLIVGALDYCNSNDAAYLFFAERPLFAVTLASGARREILSVDDLYAGVSYGRISAADLAYCDCQVLVDRTYFLPLGDRSWPDDTLVEFEYMVDDAGGLATPATIPAANGVPR